MTWKPGVALALWLSVARVAAGEIFEVPGHEREMGHLEDLLRMHRVLGPDTTLWDPWLPMCLLWLDRTNAPSTRTLRETYRDRFLQRRIDPEGYVATQQHEGLAHSQGWPFPLWTQAGGVGWHFTVTGVPYGAELGVRATPQVDDWTLSGAVTAALDSKDGWRIQLGQPGSEFARESTLVSPAIVLDTSVSPFFRLKWSGRNWSPESRVRLDWQTEGDSTFVPGKSMLLSPPNPDGSVGDVDLPLFRHPGWKGRITRLRLAFLAMPPDAEVTLLRCFSAIDSRHNINNAAYLQGCDDYLRWSGDLDFLRRNIQRMRLALAWAIREFQIAEKQVVFTPWIGHEGRSGHSLGSDGKRTLLRGVGVGNNYWDLLPFGGEDALATIYYFDAIRRMAALERHIQRNPDWNIPGGPLAFEPAELLELAQGLQRHGNERFWDKSAGRFIGWRDTTGTPYDYGFTFVNNEAIAYGFASTEHALSIRDWIDGRRIVPGDTSTGADIYHWRFGPRATTRRNVETYLWAWSDPGAIPWGGQVQDGGAVLGFSYHDIMARLETNGPDDAWSRLREVAAWFAEVQQAGGYRAYYADKNRGTLQGGGTAGGLGLDSEFFESALVPQTLLYGFLGFRPRPDGCLLAPNLPVTWTALTIRGIRLHDVSLDVTAEPNRIRVLVRGRPSRPLRLFTPGSEDSKVEIKDGLMEITPTR
ncbi:MAG: hypothetical protein AB7O66_20430 [Limisphaerales bacterium]